MKYLLILNDPTNVSERSYKGFGLAKSLSGQEGNQVRVFRMGDGVTRAVAGQPGRVWRWNKVALE